MKKNYEKSSEQENTIEVSCSDCNDTGTLIEKIDEEYNGKTIKKDVARPCHCLKQKSLKNRFKNALIPDEFKHARFDNYKRYDNTTNLLYEATINYLKKFNEIISKGSENNSLGFIAKFGESRIKALSGEARHEAKERHNNFGIGKTHLQMAAAKWILNNVKVRDEIAPGQFSSFERGCRVLCVSDITFMNDLINAMFARNSEQGLNEMIYQVTSVDVLVWDDLGKSKWSEAKEDLYYRIINERYINKKPIIFSSNEDEDTLSEKIGYAAASRLNGMCGNRLYAVEGQDYRLRKGD